MTHSTVRIAMPLSLTPEMTKAVREHPTTSVSNNEEWYTRLGWLICAYDVLLASGPPSPPSIEQGE